jgi:hypothetical protein
MFQAEEKTMPKRKDLHLDYQILSPVEIWKPRGENNYFFSLIVGEISRDETRTGLLIQNVKRDSKHSLYFDSQEPYKIFPLRQISSTKNNPVVLFNSDGELLLSNDGKSFLTASSKYPARAALASRPLEIDTGQGSTALLLTTQSFEPFVKNSKDTVDLVNSNNGRSVNGFPLAIPGTISSHPPIYDSINNIVYLLSESKEIYAVNVKNGKMINNFPVTINSKSKPSDMTDTDIKLSLHAGSGILYISQGDNRLITVDVKTGNTGAIQFSSEKIIDAVFVSHETVYFVEAHSNRLAKLNKLNKIEIIDNIKLPEGFNQYQSTVFYNNNQNFISIISIPTVENDIQARHDLYNEIVPKSEKKEVDLFVKGMMMEQFDTDDINNLTEEQKKIIKKDELDAEDAYLENTLGAKKLSSLVNEKSSGVSINVLKDSSGEHIEAVISNEKIKECTYLSDSSFYSDLYPSIYMDNDSILLAIPLNKDHHSYDDDDDGMLKSLIRVYNLK